MKQNKYGIAFWWDKGRNSVEMFLYALFFFFFTPRYNPFTYKTTFYNAVMARIIAIQCKCFLGASHKLVSGKI